MTGSGARGKTEGGWLTLGEAARLLGVDETTLRGWADAGKVRVYRTPGGHRRFSASDLEALIAAPGSAAAALDAMRGGAGGPEGGESPRDWIASRPWFARVDEASRTRVRTECGSLMESLTAYLEGDVGARATRLADGRRIGADLGREVARWGLTPAQSTEVFLHFKRGVTDMLAGVHSGGAGQVRSMRDADAFLGDALQAMMEAYEEERSA